ncbi:MAG: hypothetical protein CMI26_14765 [Opitutae bacterium]|nr:hypothetical protein [Opitutae bacterium]
MNTSTTTESEDVALCALASMASASEQQQQQQGKEEEDRGGCKRKREEKKNEEGEPSVLNYFVKNHTFSCSIEEKRYKRIKRLLRTISTGSNADPEDSEKNMEDVFCGITKGLPPIVAKMYIDRFNEEMNEKAMKGRAGVRLCA